MAERGGLLVSSSTTVVRKRSFKMAAKSATVSNEHEHEQRKAFLLGCTSLRFANMLDASRAAPDHVVEMRGCLPRVKRDGGEGARRHRVAGDHHKPATVLFMTGWLYLMMLILTPMYLLVIFYFMPQTIVTFPEMPVGEINGDAMLIMKDSAALRWELADDNQTPPCAPVVDYLRMCPPITIIIHTVVVAANATTRRRRSTTDQWEKTPNSANGKRDLLEFLRGSYEDAKAMYEDVKAKVEDAVKAGSEQIGGTSKRNVRSAYLTFRIARSVGAANKMAAGMAKCGGNKPNKVSEGAVVESTISKPDSSPESRTKDLEANGGKSGEDPTLSEKFGTGQEHKNPDPEEGTAPQASPVGEKPGVSGLDIPNIGNKTEQMGE